MATQEQINNLTTAVNALKSVDRAKLLRPGLGEESLESHFGDQLDDLIKKREFASQYAPLMHDNPVSQVTSTSMSLKAVVAAILTPGLALAQSGTTGTRATARPYGVNLTFAVYQYDATRSGPMEEVTRLTSTFSTAQDETRHLKEKYKLEGVEVRHIRSVGLQSGQPFNDAVLLGPAYMSVWVTPAEVVRGYMKLDVRVEYGKDQLLDVQRVELDNFETVMLRGGKGMFGVKFFVGAGGRQESAPVERTLLVSVTPEIVPLASLRNKPAELSRPVDEHGSPIELKQGDRFSPPVPIERAAPQFESGRPLGGSVLLSGIVTPDGKIINIRVVRSLEPVIDERAVDALRLYRFSPALLNGKPVYATYREEVNFARQPTPLEIQEQQEKQDRQKESEKDKRKRKP